MLHVVRSSFCHGRARFAGLVVASVLGLAIACGGGPGSAESAGGASSSGGPNGASSGAPGTGSEWQEICQTQAKSYCESQAVCSAKDFAWSSVDTCIAAMRDTLCASYEMASSASLDGFSALIGPAALDCLKKQAAFGPSCRPLPTITEADVEAYRAQCSVDKILPAPTRNLGEKCLVEYQCQRGTVCTEATEQACGACVEVTEGKPCEHRRDCGTFAGFDCNRDKVCARNAALGESCETRSCDSLKMHVCGYDKKCTTMAKRDEDCSMRPCDSGLFLYCSNATKKCKPLPRNPGDSCAEDKTCGAGLFCDYTAGICKTLLKEGENCKGITTAQGPCDPLLGLACDVQGGTCKLTYARVGEVCENNSYPPAPDCWQSQCSREGADKGKCVPFSMLNESCEGDRKCAKFLLCSESKKCQSVAESIQTLDAGAGGFSQLDCLK